MERRTIIVFTLVCFLLLAGSIEGAAQEEDRLCGGSDTLGSTPPHAIGGVKLLDQQPMKQWKVPRGSYSGITPLGDNRYAVVSDKQKNDGYYEFLIEQNDTTGEVEHVEVLAYHSNERPPRDAEAIAFYPDSNTVFIAAEDDQRVAEYTLAGQRTGRALIVPNAFSRDSIYGNFGFEALSYNAATNRFWTCTENTLRRDGPLATPTNPLAAHVRMQTFGSDLLPSEQYPYTADCPTPNKKHRSLVSGVSDIVALDDGTLLVLERDAMLTKLGVGNRVDNRIYHYSPADSTKTLQKEWTTRFNLTDMDFANYEGMCLGTRLIDGKQTILLLADSENGAGNFLFRLPDYIRVGVLGDTNAIITARERMKQDALLPPDSVVHIPKIERFFSNRWTQSLYIGVPLIAAGLIVKGHDHHFRSLRNDYTPSYHCRADDYIAVLPVLVTAGLKFAGYDGRSEWPHRVVSGLFSFAINAITIKPMKSMTRVARPDGGGHLSFPSNHAAFVFGATARLVKEYGDISPWIGYGGYTLATGVCAMRMMNNRHWMSDVLVGAGIGMLGTEFSYWLADLCCPKWANTYRRKDEVMLKSMGKPHFLGIFAGFYMPLKDYSLAADPTIHSGNGATFGIEGAYFVNKYIGFGGQMSIADLDYYDEDDCRLDETTRFTSIKVGCYFNYSPYPRLAVGAKVLGGYTHYPQGSSNIFEGKHATGICGMAGINLNLRPRDHLLFKFGMDYEAFPSPTAAFSYMQSLVFTGGATILF